MIILAIETSCDETGIAIIKVVGTKQKPTFKVLSNIVSSQIAIHAPWGGVVPNLAKREHIKNLPIVLKRALRQAKISKDKIDVISVTSGPGLEPALWTGINFAQELAKKWNKPLIPINHMEGHIFANFLSEKKQVIKFPTIALLVSGGHTQLVLVEKLGKYKIVGETLDDAAGEAFDKVAKMLGLPYPGGPVVSAEALKSDFRKEIKLPRPMINSKNFEFSFSGLKTAVLYLIRDEKEKFFNLSDSPSSSGSKNWETFLKETTPAICKEFQQAVIDVLIKKTFGAVEKYNAKTIILGGGVAANDELRKQFSLQPSIVNKKIKLIIPEKALTADNGAMIGAATYYHALNKEFVAPDTIIADGNLTLK